MLVAALCVSAMVGLAPERAEERAEQPRAAPIAQRSQGSCGAMTAIRSAALALDRPFMLALAGGQVVRWWENIATTCRPPPEPAASEPRRAYDPRPATWLETCLRTQSAAMAHM